MNTEKTIAITGGTGFVGSHLIPVLRELGYTLILLEHNSQYERNDQKIIRCNVSDWTTIDYLFQEKQVDGIIHLATNFVVAHNPEQIYEIINSNIALGTRLLDSAVKAHIQWFINIGTFWQHYCGAVYDPVNLYAATKQAFETVAEFYSRNYNIRFVTLCLNDTYGAGDTRKKIFPLWKRLTEFPDECMAMSPGEQLIDILHINDVVSGIVHLCSMLENNSPEIHGKNRFYLSSNNLISLKDIAKIFAKVSGKKLNIQWGKRDYRPKEVMYPQCYGVPLPGWNSTIPLEEGISGFLKEK